MKNLIIIEINKFFKRKKNIITIVFLGLFVGIFVLGNIAFDDEMTKSNINSYKEELQSAEDSLNSLKQEYNSSEKKIPSLFNLISKTETQVNLIKERNKANLNNDWKTELNTQLKLDKQLIVDIQSGRVISGENTDDIKKRIQRNQILYDENIKPINENSNMSAYNFIRLVNRDLLPILSIIIVLLLSADVISNESDEGTFKFLLTQPISRSKVIVSKIVSTSILCLFSIFSVIFLYFITLGFTKGFGSRIYPTEYYTGNFSALFYNSNTMYKINFISIKKFIMLSVPLNILLIFFITSMGVLISTIIQNSIAAMCTSIVIAISVNIITTQLRFFNKISEFIPFTYSNVVNLLNGNLISQFKNKNITYLGGIIVLLSFTLIFHILSVVVFNKRDIKC